MNALIIGRFQPFHNGHLHIIKKNYSKYDKMYIGIGSSQYNNSFENPFTYEERKTMIIKALEKEGIHNFDVIAIPDLHNPPKWVDHVKRIVNDFEIVLSNNDFTSQLFAEKGYQIEKTALFHREKYAGKEIRRKIKEKEEWKQLVPAVVFQYIQEIKGDRRIQLQ